MSPKTVTLDLREEFRAGQSPRDTVYAALHGVGPQETLRLLVPFEPVPLFSLAAKLGLAHTARPQEGGDWEVLFTRNADRDATPLAAEGKLPSSCDGGGHDSPRGEVLEVDARGLPPPQPMVVILEALQNLPAHAVINARTDRRPVHLYGFLEERGYTGESEEETDGSFITHICRR